MPRRVSLPGAAELFRTTHPRVDVEAAAETDAAVAVQTPTIDEAAQARGSGRVRHDEKITVYVSRDELLALEQARLTLRAHHQMAVDRGRIVREAIAGAMADLAENGDDSELVRRLSQP